MTWRFVVVAVGVCLVVFVLLVLGMNLAGKWADRRASGIRRWK